MLSRFSKSINQRNQLKIRVEWLESAHLSTEVFEELLTLI